MITTSNGNPLSNIPEYKTVYTIGSIVCNNCQKTIQPQGLVPCETVNDILPVATALHQKTVRDNKVICGDPKVSYCVWECDD